MLVVYLKRVCPFDFSLSRVRTVSVHNIIVHGCVISKVIQLSSRIKIIHEKEREKVENYLHLHHFFIIIIFSFSLGFLFIDVSFIIIFRIEYLIKSSYPLPLSLSFCLIYYVFTFRVLRFLLQVV